MPSTRYIKTHPSFEIAVQLYEPSLEANSYAVRSEPEIEEVVSEDEVFESLDYQQDSKMKKPPKSARSEQKVLLARQAREQRYDELDNKFRSRLMPCTQVWGLTSQGLDPLKKRSPQKQKQSSTQARCDHHKGKAL